MRSRSPSTGLLAFLSLLHQKTTDPHIKIAVPFGGTSFQAIWQTGSAQRRKQHIGEGHVSVLPANLPHEVMLESLQEIIAINFKPAFIYQPGTPEAALNHLEPYLQTVFGFIGITDMSFIYAHSLQNNNEARQAGLTGAREAIQEAIAHW